MPDTIHIVEPTLTDATGHCMSFVSSLAQTSPKINFKVWADHLCELNTLGSNVLVEQYFFRKIRKFQCIFLYKKLLLSSNKILISTASRLDLAIFNWVAKCTIPSNKIYFYFHWINSNEKKITQLRKIAKKQPNLIILTPNQSVLNVFKEAGFENTKLVPYPTQHTFNGLPYPSHFKHAWYAGAARQDKGFGKVVDLIELAQKLELNIPFAIQASRDHYGKYDEKTEADVARLHAFSYSHLKVCKDTLSVREYHSYFEGAVCIQAYSSSDFSDRISGVTLDAMLAGCPIISSSGTWTANQVRRFNAGVILDNTSPESMLSALEEIINQYEFYCQNAMHASKILKKEHEASHLANAVLMSSDQK
jgi:glycosyltransferase involved in cell wall biosynthesis